MVVDDGGAGDAADDCAPNEAYKPLMGLVRACARPFVLRPHPTAVGADDVARAPQHTDVLAEAHVRTIRGRGGYICCSRAAASRTDSV